MNQVIWALDMLNTVTHVTDASADAEASRLQGG
jgi:hypothetical protein